MEVEISKQDRMAGMRKLALADAGGGYISFSLSCWQSRIRWFCLQTTSECQNFPLELWTLIGLANSRYAEVNESLPSPRNTFAHVSPCTMTLEQPST